MVKFSDIFDFRGKSLIKAGDGRSTGKYPFYTSSNELTKYLDNFTYDGESLIFGTGGNPSIHFNNSKFSTSTDCLVAYPKNKINTKYYYYYLKGNMHILENGFKGAGLKHISKSYISNIKFPDRNSKEQKIAITIFEELDSLRQKRKQAIQMLDDFLRSTFYEMFGDPKENPNSFPVMELKSFYINSKDGTKCGPFGSALKKEEYTNNGIPVWTMDNISLDGRMIDNFKLWISESKYKELKAYSVQNGDVIISRAGTVGKMCVVNSDYNKSIISTNLIRIRFGKDLLPLYFISLMNYCKGRIGRLKTGPDGAFTHMSTGVLDTLKFPYPPLKLQEKFIKIIEEVEIIKQKMQQSLLEIDYQFNALMQKYFG